MMRIGIVKEKYKKNIRWFYYILTPLILLVTYPVLMTLNLEIGVVWLLFALICILSFVFINKITDDVVLLGQIEIDDDKFTLKIKDQETQILFSNIKIIVLHPKLGTSRVPNTFKVYECEIKTNDQDYKIDVTREEIKNGKIVNRNIMNPNAFDFIRFLNKMKINHRIEKRVY